MNRKKFIYEQQGFAHVGVRMKLYGLCPDNPKHSEGSAFMLIGKLNAMKNFHPLDVAKIALDAMAENLAAQVGILEGPKEIIKGCFKIKNTPEHFFLRAHKDDGGLGASQRKWLPSAWHVRQWHFFWNVPGIPAH